MVDMVVRRTGRTGNVTGSNPVSPIGFIVIPLNCIATEAVTRWRRGRRVRVGCFKFKSILSFPCGRRVSDMRVLLVTHCEWLFILQKSEVADITKWTEQQIKRLSELANEGLTNIEIAPMLSEEFGEEFSWPSVRSKRARLGLPPSEKNMRVKQPSDH